MAVPGRIEHYSVAYFDGITAFVNTVLPLRGVRTCCVNLTDLHSVYEPHPQRKFCVTAL